MQVLDLHYRPRPDAHVDAFECQQKLLSVFDRCQSSPRHPNDELLPYCGWDITLYVPMVVERLLLRKVDLDSMVMLVSFCYLVFCMITDRSRILTKLILPTTYSLPLWV